MNAKKNNVALRIRPGSKSVRKAVMYASSGHIRRELRLSRARLKREILRGKCRTAVKVNCCQPRADLAMIEPSDH